MKNTHRIETTIVGLDRKPNSPDGNPRYLVTTTDGTWLTAPDSAVNYSISNSEYLNTPVKLTFSGSHITGVDLLTKEKR